VFLWGGGSLVFVFVGVGGGRVGGVVPRPPPPPPPPPRARCVHAKHATTAHVQRWVCCCATPQGPASMKEAAAQSLMQQPQQYPSLLGVPELRQVTLLRRGAALCTPQEQRMHRQQPVCHDLHAQCEVAWLGACRRWQRTASGTRGWWWTPPPRR